MHASELSTCSGLVRSPASTMRCGVLWFVHVPKTGGTTVTQWLKKYGYSNGWWPLYTLSKNQYRTYGSDHPEARLRMAHVVKSAQRSANASARQQWSVWQAIWKAASRSDGPPPRFLVHTHTGSFGTGSFLVNSGMFSRLSALLARRGCGLAVVSVVREPVERTASWAIATRVAHADLKPRVKWIGNAQSQYLWHGDEIVQPPQPVADLHSNVVSLLRDCVAVCGVTDKLAAFAAEVTSLLGWSAAPLNTRLNVANASMMQAFSGNYTDEDKAVVRQFTWLDRRIFESCRQRWIS